MSANAPSQTVFSIGYDFHVGNGTSGAAISQIVRISAECGWAKSVKILRESMSPGSWLTVGAAIFAVRFVASEAFFEKSSIQKGKLIFPPVLGVRILFGLGVPGFLLIAARIAQTEDLRRSWFVLLFSLSLAILLAIFMPSTLIIDKVGIRERKWFGLKRKSFNWSNIEYVFSNPAERSFIIGSYDGGTMTHTPYHIDRDAFQDALKRYCKK